MSNIVSKGIDVSYANGVINWQLLKANPNVDFAMLRSGYGRIATQKDKQFEANYKNAKAAGVPIGVYHYSYAMSAAEALQEAQACIEMIKGKQFEYPVCFDFEETSAKYNQQALPAATKAAIINAFCGEIEKAGYWVSVYSFASMLANIPYSSISRFDCWVAHTGVAKPSYNNPYGIWQYSHTGNVPGANTSAGKCDLNYAYKDYPALIKAAGLNGFAKSGYVFDVQALNMATEGEAKTIAGMIEARGYKAEIIKRKV